MRRRQVDRPARHGTGALNKNDIAVQASRKGTDGLVHIAMCGASTGILNVYSIPTQALAKARELGFQLLITRNMTKEIQSTVPTRRASPQSRGLLRERFASGGQIPQLW